MASIRPNPIRSRRRPPGGRKASKERLAAVLAANTPHIPNVRVMAASPALQRVLVHPSGRKLRASGATEWPMDKFTARRLAEGSITIEKKEEKKEPQHERPARERERSHSSSTSSQHHTSS